MDLEWTDPRDERVWRVFNFNSTSAMHVSSELARPDAGEEMIGFRHPPEPQSFEEGGAIANPEGHRVDELSDQVFMGLLDAALERPEG